MPVSFGTCIKNQSVIPKMEWVSQFTVPHFRTIVVFACEKILKFIPQRKRGNLYKSNFLQACKTL